MAKVAIVIALVLTCLVSVTVSASYYLSPKASSAEVETVAPTPSPTASPTPTPSSQPTPKTTPHPVIYQSQCPLFPAIDPSTVVTPWGWTSYSINDGPTTMQVLLPQNGEVLAQRNVTLQVNLGTHQGIIYGLKYKADWLAGNVTVFLHLQPYNGKLYLMSPALTVTTTLHDVPVGNHNITVYGMFAQISNSAGNDSDDLAFTVNFTVNEEPPQ